MAETKWIAHREHNVARARFLAIGERDCRQIFLVDFQQRNVGPRIGADFFCLVFAQLRSESHHDFLRSRNDVISGENVSIRAHDHARAEALKRLLALSLRKLSAEVLSQRVVGKWKCRYAPRHRLSGKHGDNTRRDLVDDRGKTCDNTRLRGRGFLHHGRKRARRHAQNGADQQPAGPENSFLHKRSPFRESQARPQAAPLLTRLATKVERVVLKRLTRLRLLPP